MFHLMACRPVALLALAFAAIVPAAASEPASGPLELTLRAHAQVGGARVVLGDVVELPPGAASGLARLDLGPAPRVSAAERLSRAQIAHLIRGRFHQPLPALAWRGAEAVRIQSLSQTVAGGALAAAAVDAVLAAYGARHPGLETAIDSPPADLDIALGSYTIRARPLDAALPARAAVWLDLVADGAVLRSVVVPVTLTWRRPVYLARHTLASGSLAQVQDFDVREENVAGRHAQAVTDAMPATGLRLRRALWAGKVLTRDLLAEDGMVFPGDRVRVHTRSGPIGIDVEGVAQAQASPGQLVAVRIPHSTDTLTGRVTAAGTVVME